MMNTATFNDTMTDIALALIDLAGAPDWETKSEIIADIHTALISSELNAAELADLSPRILNAISKLIAD